MSEKQDGPPFDFAAAQEGLREAIFAGLGVPKDFFLGEGGYTSATAGLKAFERMTLSCRDRANEAARNYLHDFAARKIKEENDRLEALLVEAELMQAEGLSRQDNKEWLDLVRELTRAGLAV